MDGNEMIKPEQWTTVYTVRQLLDANGELHFNASVAEKILQLLQLDQAALEHAQTTIRKLQRRLEELPAQVIAVERARDAGLEPDPDPEVG